MYKTTPGMIMALIVIPFLLRSQTVVTIPVYPTDIDSCTVVYDASLGNAALINFSGSIYAHTGVITDQSTSPTDWKYVIAEWNQNIPKALMTPLGNDKYQIRMTPSIRAWYGVPAGEKIEKLAFVFRNSDGSKVGREANGADIYSDVYPAATSVNIILPDNKALFPDLNDTIAVKATSPLADSLKIYVNNVLVKAIAGTTITDTILADPFGHYWVTNWVKIVAVNDTAARADSFSYTVVTPPVTAELPQGVVDGINYMDSTTVILSLFAPGKKNVFVIGSFNDWHCDSAHYMMQTSDNNRYWIRIGNLIPRTEYLFQYLVDGSLRIADPYCDKVCDPDDKYIDPATYPGLLPYPEGKTTDICSYLQTSQTPYPWSGTAFTPPAATDLIIYELLIRDFTVQHDYPSLIDTLQYLKRLGINAIELMPVMEFEGNISWGYNPDFMFAPDKYYGTREGLKQFIEAAHDQGIAVILDIVLNHQFGKSPLVRLYWDNEANRPAANSPWFNQIPKHPYNVGLDFNHQSVYTREFCKRVIGYWASEYHIDGFRFDLSKGFTQVNSYPDNVALWGRRDTARITLLNDYRNSVTQINPEIYFILEHFADNNEEKELSDDGMMLWGNLNNAYSQGTMGWNSGTSSDFSWISYVNRGWADPHVIGYMESHDEERQMFRNISSGNISSPPYSCRDTSVALLRSGMAAAFFLTIPGPKMFWQFEELGYDYSINYPSGTSASRLDPKPIRWDYLQQWRRKYLFNTVAALADLKKNQPVFETADFTLNVRGALKGITLRSQDMDVAIIGNFDVAGGTIVPGFTKTGIWYDYFSGDSLNVANLTDGIDLSAGEYHLYTTKKLPKPIFTAVDEPGTQPDPGELRLAAFPNPSSERFQFGFYLERKDAVSLAVYDMLGNQISGLFTGTAHQGYNRFHWDCRNDTGVRVPDGLYICVLKTSSGTRYCKLMVVTP
ncbi:MAG: T9SS type A sorting domain-containing protein [Alphaproteobacteria bacterium]|nr:T9SS type A sorting domain-containing protein [Alphaproteobacteria bacterium]